MVIIKTDNTKIHVRSRIFFHSTYLDAMPTEQEEMIRIDYDNIKYIDSNNYQNVKKED